MALFVIIFPHYTAHSLTFLPTLLAVVDLNDSLIKYVSEKNQAFEMALTEYNAKKISKQDSDKENMFTKPTKLVRFESSNAEVSNFARKILDTSPSEAKRARGDSSYQSGYFKVRMMPC